MKRTSISLILLAAVLLSAAAGAQPCLVEKGCFISQGVGNPPAGMAGSGRSAAMAERAARVTAMKNLLACMERQGARPPGNADAAEGRLPPWVKVNESVRLADGSVVLTLSYCP